MRRLPLILAALLLAACSASGGEGRGPVVLAAASLQEALAEAADRWEQRGHAPPVLSFAASSALARQIERGAPADLFLSANQAWMDELDRQGLLRAGSHGPLLGNALVLVAPRRGGAQSVDLGDPAGFIAALGSGPLAMGDPDAVPAGSYGRAALQSLGLWRAVEARVARADNVRAALALVERGEAPLGVVYASDAQASPAVRVVASFPEASHPPIRYPLAVLAASTHADAGDFALYLASDEAAAIFARHGFRRAD